MNRHAFKRYLDGQHSFSFIARHACTFMRRLMQALTTPPHQKVHASEHSRQTTHRQTERTRESDRETPMHTKTLAVHAGTRACTHTHTHTHTRARTGIWHRASVLASTQSRSSLSVTNHVSPLPVQLAHKIDI